MPMWVAMMVVMMAPSLALTLWRERLGWFGVLVCAGSVLVWTILALAMHPLGLALAGVTPILAGAVVFQLVVWRMPAKRRAVPVDAVSAWGYGVRLGLDGAWSCAGFMTIVLVVGMMDMRVMAIVTVAITLDHLARHQPNVNEYAATPGSRNSIRNVRS